MLPAENKFNLKMIIWIAAYAVLYLLSDILLVKY